MDVLLWLSDCLYASGASAIFHRAVASYRGGLVKDPSACTCAEGHLGGQASSQTARPATAVVNSAFRVSACVDAAFDQREPGRLSSTGRVELNDQPSRVQDRMSDRNNC
ncbi:hypothetical protein V5799_019433 [Amblyomma americanum]|uniref:Uncharacterized protein n=1 Tax=Amblyomma americanum TaxID=6943 RepID=A0AAQ4EWJ0_AMBAM